MTDAHQDLRTALGAYLLGGLSDDEARQVETHLASCATCRAELADLGPVAAWLEEVRASGVDLAAPENPPADLGARILEVVAAEEDREHSEQRRRFWLRSGTLAAVSGAAAAAVLVVGLAVTGPDPEPVVPLEAVPVEVTTAGDRAGVTADADLVNHTWGVEVKLRGTGFRTGARYAVVVVGTDGETHPAGEFVGVGATEMLCNLNSSVLRDQAAGFEVRDEAGAVVAASSFAER